MKTATVLLCLMLSTGCTGEPKELASGESAPVVGESRTVVVRGQYQRFELDAVDRVSIDNAKLTFHGTTGSVTVEPPASSDLKNPTRHWSLVTEASLAERKLRSLTFTHNMKLDEFTLELPASNAPFRFGTFTSPAGEVMVFAWGEDSRSYWGHVTIQPAEKPR